MIITIHQPDFLPWLGFFDRWAKSDLFIILDDVQFLRRGWHHRDKIKTLHGVHWLTIPVLKRGKYNQLIKDVEIDNQQDWKRKHLETIESAYKKAPNLNRYLTSLKKIYDKNHTYLIELNIDIIKFMAAEFGITTPIVFSSDYRVNLTSTKKLLTLVRINKGTVYLTGTGAKDYLEESLFSDNGIALEWQKFEHPIYEQLYGEFVPGLSGIDYLMMVSPPSLLQ